MMHRNSIIQELGSHLPYSIFFTAAGVVLAALLTFGGILTGPAVEEKAAVECEHHHEGHEGHDEDACTHDHDAGTPFIKGSRMLFHIFHPIHLLLSAMATTAMFYRHEARICKAVLVGLLGSVGVCGVSDIFLPFVSGNLLKLSDIHLHWCVIEHPGMVLPFAGLGIVAGVLAARTVHNSTTISHSAHIFISSSASLFYLISFGLADWHGEANLGLVFIVVILSVTIPCCLSDVVFPLLVIRKDGEPTECCGHSH